MTFAIDDAIPAPVVTALRSAIIASRSRDSGTHWYGFDAPPRLLFEQVIQQLRPHVPKPDTYVGAEWWFRATSTDTGFPFHFDRDEAIRSSIVSPDLASILYLSNVGGPTVIVRATPTRRTAPTGATAVHPRAGRFAVFSGEYLHGVLPGQASRWPRVTMLVNWWKSTPTLERAAALVQPPVASGWKSAATPRVTLESIQPTRLMSNAAWLAIVDEQTSYK